MTAHKKEIVQTTRNKALQINKDAEFYGSFAEIGAGQEVARHFFRAGMASQTVAKSMSAYDKVFSDTIYGKGSRFVSEERLNKMLDHEYKLLEQRLKARKDTTCFFAFANTVATSSHEEVPSCHGWMGIRFQKRPNGPANDFIIHVRMLDRLRLQQQEALGVLGVNLISAAHQCHKMTGPMLIESLLDNLSHDRIEINYVRLTGPDLSAFDNRLLSLELVKQDISRTVLFSPEGQPLSAADFLYKRPILIQRGTFRPITRTNVTILENGMEQLKDEAGVDQKQIVPIAEINMANLQAHGAIDKKDFLDRVDTLTALGYYVLVSHFTLFADLKAELRRYTDNFIAMVIGAGTLNGLFDKSYYQHFNGGILAAFGQLIDDKTRIYVYPFKSDEFCMTAQTFHPSPDLQYFYQHLRANNFFVDMKNCDSVDTSLSSGDVREMLAADDPKWESLVPEKVRELIKERKLFGYK